MSKQPVRLVIVSLVLSVVAVGCAHEADTSAGAAGVTTTTSAALDRDNAVHRVAVARCRRASQCNRTGAGQMYLSKDECMDRETEAATQVVVGCAAGIDKARLDECIGMLDFQYCDVDMGPVTYWDECKKYCASP